MRIVDFVPRAGILVRLQATDAAAVVRELGAALAGVSGLPETQVVDALVYRERVAPTAVGSGVAIPHIRLDVPQTVGVMGLAPAGIDFRAPDGLPVRIFVAFVSRPKSGQQLAALAAVSRALATEDTRARLLAARDVDQVHAVLTALRTP
jgi:PTS system nitrogen regulatory IIA component